MKKVIKINGMKCEHCKASVERALNSIDGVQAKVDLKKNQAIVDMKENTTDQTLSDAIKEEGFEVISISDKKGLFGNL